MELTNDQKYEQGKHLLEYFVSHLEWVTNQDIGFKGYEAYIKPHIDAGDFVSKGWGYRGGFIQGMISPWQDFGDAPDAQRVCLTVSNFRADTAATYLHWCDTAISIKAHWGRAEPDSDVWHIHSLYICLYKDPGVKESSLEELGLFDGKAPNDELKRFWDVFDSMWKNRSSSPKVEGKVGGEIEELDELASLLSHNKNLILTGAPGTGKTYLAKQLATYITGSTYGNTDQIELVQFHPSYDYTDFVEGLRPVGQEQGQIGFKLVDGTFKAFCRKAVKNHDKPYVFIIDEINRGEVSKIFGELFFALDPDYRGEVGKVKTQYQNMAADDDPFKKGFYVPDKVYVIGTMNDIDRSIEPIDFAFRRRFAWYEVTPASRLSMLEEGNLNLRNPDLSQEELDAMRNKLKLADFYKLTSAYCLSLNKAISAEPCLGSKYQVGPAYFLKTLNFLDLNEELSADTVKDALGKVWELHLEPLLREYLRGRSRSDTESIMTKLRESYNGSEVTN